jgi:hypothetical protein
MKKASLYLTTIGALILLLLAGCASTSSNWTSDNPGIAKGGTKEEVISKYGEPYLKYIDSNGIQVLEYRRPAKDRGAMNTFVAVGSFGLLSGRNSSYVDIMKVNLANNKVSTITFEENVLGIGMPHTIAQQALSNGSSGSENANEKILQKTDSALTPEIKSKTENVDKSPGFYLVAQFKSSKLYPTKKDVLWDRIVSRVKNNGGLSVARTEKTRGIIVILVTSAEAKPMTVYAVVSQAKTGTKVALSLTTSELSYTCGLAANDFKKIYDACE